MHACSKAYRATINKGSLGVYIFSLDQRKLGQTMTHSFLTASTISTALGGKQSLSCNDITALTVSAARQDQSDSKQRRTSLRYEDSFLHKFMRPKSPEGNKKRTQRSASIPPDLDDIDRRFIQIRENLSKFREQDVEFRERLYSLSNSINELGSRSSLASSDVTIPSDDAAEEHDNEDDLEDADLAIENNFKNLSMSLSNEVLNSVPSITVSYYKRCWQSSDPSIHKTVNSKLLQLSDSTSSPTQWQLPQRTYSIDQLYLQ